MFIAVRARITPRRVYHDRRALEGALPAALLGR
jgi:hypothetical protein